MTHEVRKQSEVRMQKSVDSYRNNLAKIRTGRAHGGILDQIQIDYYGAMMPITQVATVTVTDAQTVSVQPWEAKMSGVIEKAIRDSDLGLNPSSSSGVIRVPMPSLTEERRRELIKVVKSEGKRLRLQYVMYAVMLILSLKISLKIS